jgi:cytochrome c553
VPSGDFLGQGELPRATGRQYDCVVKQMRDFKSGRRTHDAGGMAGDLTMRSDQDLEDLGHYLAGQH